MKRQTGEYEGSTVAGEVVRAFIPFPLPPGDPPLDLDGDLAPLLARAREQVRLLDLAGDRVPSVEWFVDAFVRKEAVLSSQIEGTQATLMDLLEVEASGEAPVDADVEEVCGYVDPHSFALGELGRDTGLPISARPFVGAPSPTVGRGSRCPLDGVAAVAEEAIATARRLHAIVGESRERLLAREDATVFSLRLFELLPQHPIVTVNRAVDLLECSRPAATKALRVLEAADVLHALDDRKKNRAVVFKQYLDPLREGTEVMA